MINKYNNNSGIILFITLWIMVILSLLTVGLGRQTHINLALAKNLNEKTQSKYLAISGLTYALEIIKKNTDNQTLNTSSSFNPLFFITSTTVQQGIFNTNNITSDSNKPDIFNPLVFAKTVTLESGSFKINEFEDEESRININAITPSNYQILVTLIKQFDVDSDTALTIASSVVDWTDEDSNVFNPPFGTEDEYYKGFKYNCKNSSFESPEELMLIRGMTKDLYENLKDYITIFPSHGPFAINIDSAPEVVLKAFSRNFVGPQTNTTMEDADSLVNKILEYRASLNDANATAQDRAINASRIGLNPKENTIFLMMQFQRQMKPEYVHIQVTGLQSTSQAKTNLTVTVQRSDLSILYWQRN